MTTSDSIFFCSSTLPWRTSSRYRLRAEAKAARVRFASSKSRRSSLSETSGSYFLNNSSTRARFAAMRSSSAFRCSADSASAYRMAVKMLSRDSAAHSSQE